MGKLKITPQRIAPMCKFELIEHYGALLRRYDLNPHKMSCREIERALILINQIQILTALSGNPVAVAENVERLRHAECEPPRDVNYDCDPIADQRVDVSDFEWRD